MGFAGRLIRWYIDGHRPLPWRETGDPYKIWLSEIILQQTRVNQGIDYYQRFIDKYPDIHSLSSASEQDVLKLWQGLGYYTRARNLLETARIITENYNGVFPDTYKEVAGLKGIGPYTASAILSIAFNKPYPVMDGNVLRVMSRYFAIKGQVSDAKTLRQIQGLLDKNIDRKRPGLFNQAMMELGALICLPRNPSCKNCVLRKDCKAFMQDRIAEFPAPKRKTIVLERYFSYLVIRLKEKGSSYIYISRRGGNDIWKNLYDFPLIETCRQSGIDILIQTQDWKDIFKGTRPVILAVSEHVIHHLTHRKLIVQFIEVNIKRKIKNEQGYIKVKPDQIQKYPFPRLVEKYLNERFS